MKQKLIKEIERLYQLEKGLDRLCQQIDDMICHKQEAVNLQHLVVELNKVKRGE